MKKKRKNDDDATRGKLAWTVLWFLGIAAIVVLVLFALERELALSRESIAGLRGVFAALFFLTAMTFAFYFGRRT